MNASSTQRLIKRMLEKGDLMPETREELQDYLADLEKGSLHADDARYVEGLARRLGFAEGGGAPAAANDDEDDDDDESAFLGDERAGDTAAAVQAEIALRSVEQARALVGQLRQTAAGGGPAAETAAEHARTLDELDKALADAAAALTRT